MKKEKPKEEILKTTLRVPRPLWEKVRHRAIDEGIGAGELVLRALYEYVKKGDWP
jgi:hypothetical protein